MEFRYIIIGIIVVVAVLFIIADREPVYVQLEATCSEQYIITNALLDSYCNKYCDELERTYDGLECKEEHIACICN